MSKIKINCIINILNVSKLGDNSRNFLEENIREGLKSLPTSYPSENNFIFTMNFSQSIPHFVYNDECNVDQVMCQNDMKDSLERGISLILMPFFIKAANIGAVSPIKRLVR